MLVNIDAWLVPALPKKIFVSCALAMALVELASAVERDNSSSRIDTERFFSLYGEMTRLQHLSCGWIVTCIFWVKCWVKVFVGGDTCVFVVAPLKVTFCSTEEEEEEDLLGDEDLGVSREDLGVGDENEIQYGEGELEPVVEKATTDISDSDLEDDPKDEF